MKTGIICETEREFRKYVPYDYITEVSCKFNSAAELTISQKLALQVMGYDEQQIDSFRPMMEQCERWYFVTGWPRNYVLDSDEMGRWKQVVNICGIIVNYRDVLDEWKREHPDETLRLDGWSANPRAEAIRLYE